MSFPRGIKAIREFYGTPSIDPNPAAELAWRKQIMGAPAQYPAPLPNGATRIYCHRKIRDAVEMVLRAVYDAGLWHLIETIGCYNFRTARGLQKLSTHGWAAALDVNGATNRLGSEGDMDPRIVAIFEDHGWTWGGRWSRKDPMHFQACSGY